MGPPSEDDGKLGQGHEQGMMRECFNGAAVRGRRKDERHPAVPRTRRLASMGPPSEDDGKQLVENMRKTAQAEASMGPPSEDDGKSGPKVAVLVEGQLQWGRRPRTTERCWGMMLVRTRDPLQWGRRPRTTER